MGIKGDHLVKLVAHAAPAVKNNPGFRQFELFLDGMSFFNFPKIFELGHASSHNNANNDMTFATYRGSNAAHSASSDPVSAPNLDRWDAQSVDFHHAPSTYPEFLSDNSVLSDPTPPASVTPTFASPPTYPEFLSDNSVRSNPTPSNYCNPEPNLQSFASPPSVAAAPFDEFAPVCPPPPTTQDISNQIMSAYDLPQTMTTIENGPDNNQSCHTQVLSLPPTLTSATPALCNTPPRDSPVSNISSSRELCNEKFSMNNLYETEASPQSVRQLGELETAMQNLVNLDDINQAAEAPMKLTMMKNEEQKKNIGNGKSVGLPPINTSWLGAQAPLSEIQAHAPPRAAPSKEVMRAHAFDPAAQHAGMMVVYGSSADQAPRIQNNLGYNTYGRAY